MEGLNALKAKGFSVDLSETSGKKTANITDTESRTEWIITELREGKSYSVDVKFWSVISRKTNTYCEVFEGTSIDEVVDFILS